MKASSIVRWGIGLVLVLALAKYFSVSTDSSPGQAPKAPVSQSSASESPSVPGGLEAHDRAGGHVVARHVGKSEAELSARLRADPRISGASSFSDLATADRAIGRLLLENDARIKTWLASGNDDDLVVRGKSDQPVGISIMRGHSTATAVSGVRAILRKDRALECRYRVHTAYPEK